MIKNIFAGKRFKHGSLAVVVTVIFLAAVVLVNVIVGMLVTKFPVKLDLTTNGLFEVSDKTRDYLKELDSDVHITVTTDEAGLAAGSAIGKQVVELVNKYAQYSDKITVSFLNPEKNPELIADMNKRYAGDVTTKIIVIESGERIKALAASEIINQDYTTNKASSNAEQALTSAIMAVTDANPMKITLLTGESGSDVTALENILSTNGYIIEEVDPLTGAIDQESKMVIVNSPIADYTDTTIKKLDTFMSNDGKLGKNLVYIASIYQKPTPNIDAFLTDWGLSVGEGYVMDSDPNYTIQGSNGSPIGMYAQVPTNDYTATVENKGAPLFLPLPRPVYTLFTEKDTRKTTSILATNDTAFVVTADTTNENVVQAKQNIIALGTKTISLGSSLASSNVLAIGSGDMFIEMVMTTSTYSNGSFSISMLNKLNDKEMGITIVPKDLMGNVLGMADTSKSVVAAIAIFVIPIVIIGLGVVVWLRRRNR